MVIMRSVVSLRLRAVAALLTLLSGGLMMLAGYLGHEASWSTDGWVTLPAGVVILAALLVAPASCFLRRRDTDSQNPGCGNCGDRGDDDLRGA